MNDEIVEVQFKRERKEFYRNTGNIELKIGDYVIVEVDRGEDMGRVIQKGEMAWKRAPENKSQFGAVLRVASAEEIERLKGLAEKEEEALKTCHQKVEERALKMKLTDSEWQFDGNKIIFYFTADKRVDFRQLVKDLAAVFKTRIELKQIGVRDEARRIGGAGRCGFKLCCTAFLSDFEPVTLRAAKDQKLSLNPSQISGICGRLMCCLMFEREFYKQQSRKFPKEGKEFIGEDGKVERVSGYDIFHETVELENREGFRRKISLEEFNESAKEYQGRSRKKGQQKDAD